MVRSNEEGHCCAGGRALSCCARMTHGSCACVRACACVVLHTDCICDEAPLMYVHPLIPSCYLTPSTLSCTAPHKTLVISPFLSLNIRAKHLACTVMVCIASSYAFVFILYMSIYMFYITYDLFTTPLDILSHILYFSACTRLQHSYSNYILHPLHSSQFPQTISSPQALSVLQAIVQYTSPTNISSSFSNQSHAHEDSLLQRYLLHPFSSSSSLR